MDEKAAKQLWEEVWSHHLTAWGRGESFGHREIVDWIGERVGAESDRLSRLAEALSESGVEVGISPVAEAADILAGVKRLGLKTALIADTGITSDDTVRRILGEHHMLELLDVLVFSDQFGAPKPHPVVFQKALRATGIGPEQALHVGDLRRTDVAGAKAAGMVSVRFCGVFDDPDPGPEADYVIDRLEEVIDIVKSA